MILNFFGGLMRGNHTNENHVRMELKYCEHCGGLWVREGGSACIARSARPRWRTCRLLRRNLGTLRFPWRDGLLSTGVRLRFQTDWIWKLQEVSRELSSGDRGCGGRMDFGTTGKRTARLSEHRGSQRKR